MARERISPLYISASCNRASNVADARSEDGLVAFGSASLVALWRSADELNRGVHATLPGHAGNITTVKFVQATSRRSNFLLSGDSVGVVRVWKEGLSGAWSIHAVLSGHTQSISSLSSLEITAGGSEEAEQSFLIVTGGSDGAVHSWLVGSEGAELLQKIDLKGKIPLELGLSYLPTSHSIVLAVGATETKLQIYSSPGTPNIAFTKALSLEGHADWIRTLAFVTPTISAAASTSSSTPYEVAEGEVLLASGSQDNYIRLWRLSRRSSSSSSQQQQAPTGLDALDELERTLAETSEDGELRVKSHDFTVANDGEFSCSSEAVLLGHDAWVTGLHWAPNVSSSNLQLLSASSDRSMILWTPTTGSIWTSHRRFGEFTSPTNLGFFGALWGRDGLSVLAHGWGGAWHVWEQATAESEWEPRLGTGGHWGKVRSLAWEPEGEFLLSAGEDMTTRLHGVWKRDGVETWHELGRPQIHGYPLASIAFTDRLQFISGADEKIVRVFDAPKVFLSSIGRLSGVQGLGDEESRPMAANVPPLGLSNRAIVSVVEEQQLQAASAAKDPYNEVPVVDFTENSQPPLEEQLLGSTLWPETEKIYGHGYEIIAVASAPSSSLIATACKSTSPEHAVIRLFETKEWKPVGVPLAGHALTITKLAFSNLGDRWLLSVSRDRSWRLFEKKGKGVDTYEPVGSSASHTRIIWDAAWASDDSFFVTVSRDKTARVWAQSGEAWSCAATLKLVDAGTAVACTRLSNPDRNLLAVGLENGQVHLFTALTSNVSQWTPSAVDTTSHVLTVTSLAFCPKDLPSGGVRLASGSEDRGVRVVDILTE